MSCQDESIGVGIIELLINSGADIDLQSLSKGTTPLQFTVQWYTAYSQHELATQYSKFELLLKHDADITKCNFDGLGVIHTLLKVPQADEEYQKHAIQKTLALILQPKHKYDINKNGYVEGENNWFTPIQLACLYEHTYCIEMLIKNGAYLNVRLGIQGETLLNVLVRSLIISSDSITYIMDSINMFTKQGFSINTQCTTGASLLHNIVSHSPMDCAGIIREFAKHGANFNVRDMCGRTVIHEMVNTFPPGIEYGDTLATLLECGADINSTDYNGCTPLMDEIRLNPNISHIEELIKQGAHVNAVDKCGRTALHHFITSTHLQHLRKGTITTIIKRLVDSKVTLDTKDKFGRNAFNYIKSMEREQKLRDRNIFISDLPDGSDLLEENNIKEIKDCLEELRELHLISLGNDDLLMNYLKLDKKLDFMFRKSRNAFKTLQHTKHHWNTMLTHHQDAAQVNTMLTHDDVLTEDDIQVILNTPGIGKVDCVDAFKLVSHQVDLVMRNIAKKLNTQQSQFKYEVQLSGGVSEGTKVGKPDEFDYLIFVDGLIDMCDLRESSTSPGFATLQLKERGYPGVCNGFVDNDGFANPLKFLHFFHSEVFEVMKDGEVWNGTDLYWRYFETDQPWSAQHLTCANLLLQMTCPLSSFNDIVLSVDLVPVVIIPKMYNFWPSCFIDKNHHLIKKNSDLLCLTLTKSADNTNIHNTNMRVSTSLWERKLITSLPQKMINAFILLKILKQYCWITQNPSSLNTYKIKTALLHEVAKEIEIEPQQLPEYTETKQITQFAQKILNMLICSGKDKNLPSFFAPGNNLMKTLDPFDNSTSTSLIMTLEHIIYQLNIS